jgi:hypothetical protein
MCSGSLPRVRGVSGRHASDPDNVLGRRVGLVIAVLAGLGVLLTAVSLSRDDDPVTPPVDTTTSTPGVTVISTSTSAGSTSTVADTTIPPTVTTALAQTTLADPLSALALNPTGIGDVIFGTEVEEAVAQLSVVLGNPTEDTGWTPSFETCPGTEARVVRWTSLQAFFTNGATDWAPAETRHFFHYGQSTRAGGGVLVDLRTGRGIGINSTLGELASAYGTAAEIVDDPVFGPFWEVDVEGPGVLWGTAGAIGENGMIDSINGGSGCGE